MALPIRTQIRNAVVTLLTGLATTGARVYGSRLHPMATTDLPALLVYARSEQVETITSGLQRAQARVLALEVRGVAAALIGLDDSVDLIAQEVEAAMATDPQLGGLADDVQLQEVAIEADPGVETPLGKITMSYDIHYSTTEGAV